MAVLTRSTKLAVQHPGQVLLQRCLQNLLVNALRYAKDVSVTLERTATGVFIHIDDRGPGIAPALLTAPLRPRHQPHDVKTSIHCCSSQSMVPVHPVHQISICIIGSSVMLLCVLFPLDFYQKFEWRGCHHIPCMPADLHVFAIVHELASNCICLTANLLMHCSWFKILYAMHSCWLPFPMHTLQFRAALLTCTRWHDK